MSGRYDRYALFSVARQPVDYRRLGVGATLEIHHDTRTNKEREMRSHTEYRTFDTEKPQEIVHITPWVEEELGKSGIQEGLCLVSAMHITASVFINDNESGLHQDILDWLEGDLAPWKAHPARGDDYIHNRTGEDNGAAHLRNLTIGHEVIVPVTNGKLDLGPWQRIFYGEWDGRRPKCIVLKIMGD